MPISLFVELNEMTHQPHELPPHYIEAETEATGCITRIYDGSLNLTPGTLIPEFTLI